MTLLFPVIRFVVRTRELIAMEAARRSPEDELASATLDIN